MISIIVCVDLPPKYIISDGEEIELTNHITECTRFNPDSDKVAGILHKVRDMFPDMKFVVTSIPSVILGG